MLSVDALAWEQAADRQRGLVLRILMEEGRRASLSLPRWFAGRDLFVPKVREVPLQPGLSCQAQEWAQRAELQRHCSVQLWLFCGATSRRWLDHWLVRSG